MDHSQMAHHETEQIAQSNVAETIGSREQSCSHCVIHSRPNSDFKLGRTADSVKRSGDLQAPQVVVLSPLAPVSVAMLTTREHGPPGKGSRPKHVLINTFRI